MTRQPDEKANRTARKARPVRVKRETNGWVVSIHGVDRLAVPLAFGAPRPLWDPPAVELVGAPRPRPATTRPGP